MKNLRAPVLGLASCCCRCAAPWLSSAARPAARRRSPGTVPVFQHLASLNATAAAPFPPERTAWLVTLPLIVIDHAQGQGYMYGPKPTPGLGGEYGPALYNPAAFGAQYFEDAAEGAARAIHAANDGTVVHYQNGDGALPFYRQSGVRAGHARRHGAARGGVPGVEARQRQHAATLPQLQLEPVARQGARPLGQALRERDLGPQAACWTAPSLTPNSCSR